MTAPAHPDDTARLHALRRARPAHRPHPAMGWGDRVADRVTGLVGSWRFIIAQSVILVLWIVANILAWNRAWDPYPFILLNLVLSFQAAYTAPIIMMSQNRQAEIDREHAHHDYAVNVKAELEIEALHAKVDALREVEMLRLIKLVETLLEERRGPG
ncbi:DUF1003 domain-containing protein [Sabulicella glaciei]|uniref:DUF1003 domain-containing protein n=1 Tax=Sabulicella glaciei TaxID=2984948 RepID=A0ABT3NUP8_9PROT|nr:DUF1003 domain-containing protein [Roseococcus sp. MDT2-1-1]MCW8085880.1 DUF1003 domain-containing protein [Roseococcus sp. MDT2-1-1]